MPAKPRRAEGSADFGNLRDSGSIEQDADLVLFLNREPPKRNRKDKEDEPQQIMDMIPTDLIVAKQRNGPTGVVKLELVTKFAKFTPLAKEKRADGGRPAEET